MAVNGDPYPDLAKKDTTRNKFHSSKDSLPALDILHKPHTAKRGLRNIFRVPNSTGSGLRAFPYWAERHAKNLGLPKYEDLTP